MDIFVSSEEAALFREVTVAGTRSSHTLVVKGIGDRNVFGIRKSSVVLGIEISI